jgi:membrane protein YdbS with pleckstrin-like domain
VLDWLRAQILDVLRVPPEPKPPEGTPGSLLVFRAGRNFYRWQVLAWAFSHLGVAAGLLGGYYGTARYVLVNAPEWVRYLYGVTEILALVGAAIALPFTYLALRWNYDLRWYIITDRSLRIRRGVWSVEELTMTFANIQEIRVTSGPIQNWLGLADVEVHSAGGGTVGPQGEQKPHSAIFEGVDNADEIRDLLVERLKAYRDLGLGGAHESPAGRPLDDAAAHAAAHAVLQEARLLRAAFQPAE